MTIVEGARVDMFIPRDGASLVRALGVLDAASVVGCDVETTGLSPFKNYLMSIGVGGLFENGDAFVVIVPYEVVVSASDDEKTAVWDAIYRTTRRTVGQNFKFDLQFLARWFDEPIPLEADIADTLLLGYLLDERPRKDRMGSLGLKEQASYRYDKPDYHWDWDKFYNDMRHDGSYPDTPVYGCDQATCKYPHPDAELRADWSGLYKYQAQDVYYTLKLWFDLVAEANAEAPALLTAHDEVLMPAAKTLAQCELNGAPLDFEWVRRFSAWLRRRIDRRAAVLSAVARALGADEGFAIGAPAKVADLMYDAWRMTPDMRKKKYGTGGDVKEDRSTDKEHIESAVAKYTRQGTPVQRRGAKWLKMLIEWRKDMKMDSTYSETLLQKADADGRVRASFLIHGTSTGRLSSAGPNLQNIPAVSLVKGAYVERRSGKPTLWPARRAFAPRDGRLWVEADYAQLELRVAAALSGDAAFRDVFIQGRDIHLEVAATMFSKPADQISKPERFLAKAVDFGILYGRTAKALVNGLEMDFLERELGGKRWDEPTAEAFIRKFLRGYPQLSAWIARIHEDVLVDHYVESPFGRRRRFPFTPRTRYERLAIQRQAVNTPVQSAASDICLIAMTALAKRLPESAMLLFPVHDSICLEVDEDSVADVSGLLREIMEIDFMSVPLTIDIEVGASWADIH